MAIDYATLSNQELAKKYRSVLFRQSGIVEQAQESPIQLNFCDNPFCDHYGKEQKRFVDIKNKPSRYKLAGSLKSGKQLRCNDTIGPDFTDMGLDCSIEPISNWAVAEELKRLKVINAIADTKQEYVFHRDTCENSTLTPFSDPASFYRRGKSSSNSQNINANNAKRLPTCCLHPGRIIRIDKRKMLYCPC